MDHDDSAATGAAAVIADYCWVPMADLEPGMLIARKVVGGSGIHGAIHLAIGSRITAGTIAQLINKGVECVAVLQAAPRDEAAHAERVLRHEARLREIFGPNPDDNCCPLLEALIVGGPSQC